MKASHFLLFLLAAPAHVECGEILDLDPEAGMYGIRHLSGSITEGEVSVVVQIREFKESSKWAPMAGAGLGFGELARHESPRNNVRVYVAKPAPDDEFIQAGFDVLKNGETKEQRFLSRQFALSEPVTLKMEKERHRILISINGVTELSVEASSDPVTPFIFAASANAQFKDLDPSER